MKEEDRQKLEVKINNMKIYDSVWNEGRIMYHRVPGGMVIFYIDRGGVNHTDSVSSVFVPKEDFNDE